MGIVQLAQLMTLFTMLCSARQPGPLLWAMFAVSTFQNSISYRYHATCSKMDRGTCTLQVCEQFVMDTWGIIIHSTSYTFILFIALCQVHLAWAIILFVPMGGAMSVMGLLAMTHAAVVIHPSLLMCPHWPECNGVYRALICPSACVLVMVTCCVCISVFYPCIVNACCVCVLSYAVASMLQMYAIQGGVWCHIFLVGGNCSCMWMLHLIEGCEC